MKLSIYFIFFILYSCSSSSKTSVQNNLLIDTIILPKKWISQMSIMYDSVSNCCFCSQKSDDILDNIQKQLVGISNKTTFNSFQNFDISTLKITFKDYPNCRSIYPIHILQYNNISYYWSNIDFIDNIFWRGVKSSFNKNSTAYFKYGIFRHNHKIYYPENCDFDINDSLQSCYFNWHRYADTENKKGYIFPITHFTQFNEINLFMKNNEYYHTEKSLSKVDSLLFLLHNRVDNNREDITMWLKISNQTLFKDKNKIIDTVLLKKNGVDFNNISIHYFDSIITNRCVNQYNEVKDCYVSFTEKIDTLAILKEYLHNNKPTFLYYKSNANIYSNWYNYFIAYYINYQENIPKITKVDIIIPEKIYNYICYPATNCNPFAGDYLFSILENETN